MGQKGGNEFLGGFQKVRGAGERGRPGGRRGGGRGFREDCHLAGQRHRPAADRAATGEGGFQQPVPGAGAGLLRHAGGGEEGGGAGAGVWVVSEQPAGFHDHLLLHFHRHPAAPAAAAVCAGGRGADEDGGLAGGD